MAVPNSSYASDFLATTLNNFEHQIRSEILQQTVVLRVLKERAMESKDGGSQLSIPIVYDDNDTFKAYEQDGDLDLSLQTGNTVADYVWRQYAGSIVISGIDLFRNGNSKAKIVDLLAAKTKQLVDSVSYKLTTKLLSAQSGLEMNGLPDIIASSNNTVGGIDSSTYSFWRAQSLSTATFGSTAVGNGLQSMSQLMRQATRGKAPDLIITTSHLFGAFENALVNNQRILSDDESMYGFQRMKFKGADMFWDDQVTSGEMYFINTDHIKLVIGKGADFKLQNKVPPANKDVQIWSYLLYCQLIAKARRTSAKLYGVTAT